MEKISESCRLCLEKNCTIKSIEDYEREKGRPRELQEMIKETVGIEIQHDDLIKGLCTECAGMLVSIVRFRRKCHRINERLKTFIVPDQEVEISIPITKIEGQEIPDESSDQFDDFTWPESLDLPDEIEATAVKDSGPAKSTKIRKKSPKKKGENKSTYKKEEPGLCYICGGVYNYIRVHLALHQSEKRKHICTVCNKTFLYLTQLKFHRQSHEEPKFCCDICGKKLSKKQHLKFHMRIHTNERPFECSYCGKGFIRREKLTMHIRTHTGEKPFSCQVCFFKFATRMGLLQHQKSAVHALRASNQDLENH